MPRTVTLLKVFVSCPSDLDTEREMVRKAIEELNSDLIDTYQVSLDFMTWPDGFRPGLSTDGQAEINRQLGDDVDIFVGVMGSRFGTPTPRAGSGTEEEFNRAFSRFSADSSQMRLLFYFKRSTSDLFHVDPNQLAQVKSFRERIGRIGLFMDFLNSEEFYGQIRKHLRDLVHKEWMGDKWRLIELNNEQDRSGSDTRSHSASSPMLALPPEGRGESLRLRTAVNEFEAIAANIESDEAESGDNEPWGILDLQTEIEGGFELVSAFANHMTELMNTVSSKFEARTESINSSRGPDGTVSAKKAKEIIDETASDLDWFNSMAQREIPGLKEGIRRVFMWFPVLLDEYSSVQGPLEVSQEPSDMRPHLDMLDESVRMAREGVKNFRQAFEGVPALTSKFSRSRKRTMAVLADLDAELTVFLTNIDELRDRLVNEGTGEVLVSAS